LPNAADRQLDVGVPPAVDQMNFERVTGLLVDLRDAVLGRGGAADVAPAVRLQRVPHRNREAVDIDPTPIHEPRGLDLRRLDDRGLVRLVREPVRYGDVFELASSRLRRRSRAPGGERDEKQHGECVLNSDDRSKPWVIPGVKPVREPLTRLLRPGRHLDPGLWARRRRRIVRPRARTVIPI